MPEPVHEQIVQTLADRLATIVGDNGATYHYTADRVVRAPMFYGGCVRDRADELTFYVLSPDRTPRRRETSKSNTARMRLDLTVAQRFRQNEEPLNPTLPLRETVQARLAADAERKLLEPATFNALNALGVWNVEVTDDDRTAEETNVEGWVLAFLRLSIEFKYRTVSP